MKKKVLTPHVGDVISTIHECFVVIFVAERCIYLLDMCGEVYSMPLALVADIEMEEM